MGFLNKKSQSAVPAAQAPPPPGAVNLTKDSGKVNLSKNSGGVYTLITTWGEKDYDLYALVEYTDGHVETVSCFGTVQDRQGFSLRTSDGAVEHVSGDKTAYADDLPQEVMIVRLNPNIRRVVPVVYSAKNSGTGSFRRYQVSTYVIEGEHQVVPTDGSAQMVRVEAIDASNDDRVYTFVPAVIHNEGDNPSLEALELYSKRNSELRPAIIDGAVMMDAGPENSGK